MAQIIGNPALGIGGMALGTGIDGQLVHLWASGDPNTLTDASLVSAATGSLFTRFDGSVSTCLYVKTAFVAGSVGTWTAK